MSAVWEFATARSEVVDSSNSNNEGRHATLVVADVPDAQVAADPGPLV